MRVLVISHMYPTIASPLGGIFVQKQAEALAARGTEVTVVHPTPYVPAVFRFFPRWGHYARIPRRETVNGIEVRHPRVLEFPRGYFFDWYPKTYIRGMKRTLAGLIKTKKPDIIHAHVAHPDGAAAVYFGKKYGIPVVVTIHGQDFAHTLYRSPRCERSLKTTLALADRVVLVSDKLRHNYGLDDWADDLTKYRVIYNGVNLEELAEDTRAERDKAEKGGAGEGEKAPVLVTVGFLRKFKGHAYVLEALPVLLPKYPGLLYHIVGDGAERQVLEKQARELGLEKNVLFLGSLSHAEAMKEIARSDLFLMPSWNEAFGVVYLEALAHGKPVIGTKGEGIAPIIEREQVGITVPARNAKALAEALDLLLSHPESSRQMGERGRALVRREFTWEQNALQTCGLYQEILNSDQRDFA
ncbi:glycosyl transferase group 1 [Syntrophobotulus glycolicus DSM 8271]|uniref:Glycosyl transferase group 1 n=2 Tax=Syntrophobotulus TaxID=51196 RepID=F0SZV2_SYNGF|nr:glycosyl transferase group 1 [Syntrophobotulus glycolicus DSM 8271]